MVVHRGFHPISPLSCKTGLIVKLYWTLRTQFWALSSLTPIDFGTWQCDKRKPLSSYLGSELNID